MRTRSRSVRTKSDWFSGLGEYVMEVKEVIEIAKHCVGEVLADAQVANLGRSSYPAGILLDETAVAGTVSVASISSIVRPRVSIPMNQNATAPSTYQNAK
jgi:hypothetical protein